MELSFRVVMNAFSTLRWEVIDQSCPSADIQLNAQGYPQDDFKVQLAVKCLEEKEEKPQIRNQDVVQVSADNGFLTMFFMNTESRDGDGTFSSVTFVCQNRRAHLLIITIDDIFIMGVNKNAFTSVYQFCQINKNLQVFALIY